MSKKRGFTLIELLAVIVILAIIVVIAVPEIMDIITESTKGALISSAKLIASSAESMKVSNKALGITKEITCEDVAKLTTEDYKSCYIKFDSNGKAKVTIIGKGKFAGMSVCRGTKEDADVTEECIGPINFGSDSWTTIATAVRNGDTSSYNVGDTKTVDLGTLGTHTLRIANTTPCDGTLASETACGFVLEFADMITKKSMNLTKTNVGGWPASEMRKYLNDLDANDSTDGVIYNALVSAIGDIIIDTTVVSSHGSGDTTGTLANNNFESTDKVYLLSTREVYGKEGTSNQVTEDTADGDAITRQLDYYKNNNVTTSSYSGAIKVSASSYWWLRSASSNSTTSFYYVFSGGLWSNGNPANFTPSVSPAFRLG